MGIQIARVRVHYTPLPEWLASQTCPIYGTLLDGRDMYEVLSNSPKDGLTGEAGPIIVMGNEGNGISEDVRALITHAIRIPSYPPAILGETAHLSESQFCHV